jgi:hypothetical protein
MSAHISGSLLTAAPYVSSSDECDRLHRVLHDRIALITSGPLIEQFKQTALNGMKRAVDDARDTGSLDLLRVYALHLSEKTTPYTLRQIALALVRNGLYSPGNIMDAYLSITRHHIDAYHRLMHSSTVPGGYRMQNAVLAVAMRCPKELDRILELVNRGILDADDITRALGSMDFGNSVPLQIGAL